MKESRHMLGDFEKFKVVGRVRVEEGAEVVDSELGGPCIIGKGYVIQSSFIGDTSQNQILSVYDQRAG